MRSGEGLLYRKQWRIRQPTLQWIVENSSTEPRYIQPNVRPKNADGACWRALANKDANNICCLRIMGMWMGRVAPGRNQFFRAGERALC